MPTARSLIADALTELNILGEGETASAALASFALQRLQYQVEAWQADRLAIAVTNRVTFTLASGDNTMTIGAGGDINTARPSWINAMNYIIPGSSPPVESPLGPMDDDSYANLSIKTLSSSLPTEFYYQNTTPLGTFFFWPTVTQDVDMAVYIPQGIAAPTTLDSVLVGAAGVNEAFLYQLAVRLAAPLGRTVSPSLQQMAAESFARYKRPNTQPGLLGVDQALVSSYGGGYNILTDNTSGSSSR